MWVGLKSQSDFGRKVTKIETKQDHQRWGYSTVTHMEQPVYLAIWKDLSQKKRKEHKKRIEP